MSALILWVSKLLVFTRAEEDPRLRFTKTGEYFLVQFVFSNMR